MRAHRTFGQTLGYGGLVVALGAAAAVLVWIVGDGGIAAIAAGLPRDAILAGLLCLGSVTAAVVALAAYLHWLGTTTRDGRAREAVHIPSRAEDLMLGLGTLVVVAASVPATAYCYREARALFEDGRGYTIGYGFGYAALGVAVVAFAVFCLARYVRWMRA